MFFVAGGLGWQEGKFRVLKPSLDQSAPPICVGVYDTAEEADEIAERFNDEIDLDLELHDLPEDMHRFLKALD